MQYKKMMVLNIHAMVERKRKRMKRTSRIHYFPVFFFFFFAKPMECYSENKTKTTDFGSYSHCLKGKRRANSLFSCMTDHFFRQVDSRYIQKNRLALIDDLVMRFFFRDQFKALCSIIEEKERKRKETEFGLHATTFSMQF